MFWGLIMEPQKRYSQVVKKSFHVSMAALDLCSCSDEPVQVMCGYDNRKYLMCTLQKDGILQVPLDLNFETGDEVSFVTNGSSHVHLTGYLNEDEMTQFDQMEEEEVEDEEIKLENISNSNIVTGKRAKKINSDMQLDGLASKINKRLDDIANGAPPVKKTKTAQLLENLTAEDDSDDSDVSLSDLIKDGGDEDTTFAEDDDDDDDDDDGDVEEDGEEEEDDDEDDEEDDDEDDEKMDDSDEEEVSSLSEEDIEKPKMNGTAKKNKQEINQKAKTKQEKKAEKVKPEPVTPQGKKEQQAASPQKKSLEGGVMIEDIKVGNGQLAKSGKMVQVYYEGRLKSNNKVFDSTNKGNGFKFRLGRQEVIKGWDVGVAGMKVGGKRRITCPPNMAYGNRGAPPTIPPNSTLVFEVELKNVK